MKLFLYNIQTSYEITADSREEADEIVYEGNLENNKQVRVIDNDVMFVGEEEEEDE